MSFFCFFRAFSSFPPNLLYLIFETGGRAERTALRTNTDGDRGRSTHRYGGRYTACAYSSVCAYRKLLPRERITGDYCFQNYYKYVRVTCEFD